MTVFLTPDGRPFYGGTYFPPEPSARRRRLPPAPRRGATRAGARDVVVEARRRRLVGARSPARQARRGTARRGAPRRGGSGARGSFDPVERRVRAGRRSSRPRPTAPELLLRRGSNRALDDGPRFTLRDAMAAGGHLRPRGRGLPPLLGRSHWLVPHFEKMLYDNALLASAYLHAWLVTGEPRHRTVVEETWSTSCENSRSTVAGWRRRRMQTPTASRA